MTGSGEVEALNAEVIHLYQAGRYAEAVRVGESAFALAEHQNGPDHHSVGTTLNNLAGLYEAQGRYADAEPLYMRFLNIREKALGPDHPSVGTTRNNLADLFLAMGRYSEAAVLAKRASKI